MRVLGGPGSSVPAVWVQAEPPETGSYRFYHKKPYLAKVTFEVPPDLKTKMDAHREVNWSEVLRQAVARHIEVADIAREIEREMSDPRIRAVADRLKAGAGERMRRSARARGR